MIAQNRQTTVALESSAPQILETLAWEIELAGARCIFLDKMIGEMMQAAAVDQRPRLIEGMHAVDLLSQHLTGLAAFGRALAADAPSHPCPVSHEALSGVTLGALASRLQAALGGAEDEAAHDADSGDLDLF